MHIGIITFCDAVNYGAYLQAFSLGEYLRKNGHKVSYIRTISFKSLYWELHNLYAYHIDRIRFRKEFRHKWFAAKKKMHITSKKKGYDLVIIGSDEMWQLNSKTIKPLPFFWGVGVGAGEKITYAVCSNGTRKEDIDKYPFIEQGINELSAVSVRDVKTKDIFQPLTIREIAVHIDPTFLIDLKEYSVKPKLNKYILVYTYSFNAERIKQVREFAARQNKITVCVGNKFDWCDVSLPASPFEVLGLFENADYIVTDTFHGTVLATHFNRQFASYAENKEKIVQFLEEFGLSDRNVVNNTTLDQVFSSSINYEKFNKDINRRREQSYLYLKHYTEKGL